MRQQWGKTFILGLGFLALSAVWPLYDSYMPKFYGELINSSFLVGLIMGLDNFLGLTLQPWFGALSDRTRTRWGRRRPFLLIGMPLAALGIMAIPFAREMGFMPLLIVTIGMNLAMSIFRSPTVALMPDLVPPPQRSQANGIINFMGGIGAAGMLLFSKPLYALSPRYPFMLSAFVMLTVFVLFLFFIREPEQPWVDDKADGSSQGLLAALLSIMKAPDRKALILFISIFTWFSGYQSVSTWFTTYGEQYLSIPVNVASGILVFYAGSFVVGAIPAGLIGALLGRRRTILVGLWGMMMCFLAIHFMVSIGQIQGILIAAGFCWALVNINSYPMVVELCPSNQTGTYTGLYYIFSMAAGIAAPSLVGLLFDLSGSKRPLFLAAALFMNLAILLMLLIDEESTVTKSGQAA